MSQPSYEDTLKHLSILKTREFQIAKELITIQEEIIRTKERLRLLDPNQSTLELKETSTDGKL